MVQIVITEIQAHAKAIMLDETSVVSKLKRQMAQYDAQQSANTQQEIRQLRLRVEKLEGIIAKLYEDKISGAINENTFAVLMQKNEQERLSKAERLSVLLSEADQSEQNTAAIQNWTALIRKYLNLQELD